MGVGVRRGSKESDGGKARLGETGPTVRGPFKEFGLYPEVSGVLLQDFKQRKIVKLGVQESHSDRHVESGLE